MISPLPGRRLAALLEYAMANKLKGVSTRADLARALDLNWANLNKALMGQREFTLVQVQTAALFFEFSLDGIFGFSDQAFRKKSLSHLHVSTIAHQMGQTKSQTKSKTKTPTNTDGAA
ncbi:MAG: hypothetical protein EOP52_12405 [Sphingobacteriales bacterium]|nr:MAG: hypothetical protein EOP52_12405 [Sphingobacteriales bacterium]